MSYNFTDRLDRLGQRMSEVNGETVLISDSFDNPSFVLKVEGASRGRTECAEMVQDTVVNIARLIDFFVDTCNVTSGGVFRKPQIGWQIKDSKGRIYQVVAGPGDMPCFCYTTPSEKRMRIHTSWSHDPAPAV